MITNPESKRPRRGITEIYHDILEAIISGRSSPSRIMYKSNLSWTALQTYLKNLEGCGWLQYKINGNRKEYQITPKGIENYNRLRNILEGLTSPSAIENK